MAVLDIHKGTPSGARTPRPINTRRCHSKKRRVISPRVIQRMTIGVGARAILQNLAASVNEEARQLALAVRTRREAGMYRQGVDAQFATRSVKPAAPFARAERPLRRARLLGVEGQHRSFVAGCRVAPQACVCASPSVALLVENRHVGVERVSGSASSRPRALSRSAHCPRPCCLTSGSYSRSRISDLYYSSRCYEDTAMIVGCGDGYRRL